MYTYVVDITISEHSSHQTGRFEMIIVGDKDQAANATSVVGGEMKKFRAGKTYTLLFYAPPPKVLEIREARVKWIHKSSPFCVVFCSKDVYVKEVQVGLLMKSGKWYVVGLVSTGVVLRRVLFQQQKEPLAPRETPRKNRRRELSEVREVPRNCEEPT